jgi:hypothetical protein
MPLTPINWTSLTNAIVNGDGDLEKNAGSDTCAPDESGTGDAGGKSTETITAGDFKFECTLGPVDGESGRTFVGLDSGSFSLDFADWQFCLYSSTEADDPSPANTVKVFENGELKTYIEGAWNPGDLLQFICSNGVMRYYLNSRLLYRSSLTPTYPLFACASLACLNKTVVDAVFVSGLDILARSGCFPIVAEEGTEDVVWECDTFFAITGNDIVKDGGDDGFQVAWAQSAQEITAAEEYFSFQVPEIGPELHVGLTALDCPACTPAAGRCIWSRLDITDYYYFFFSLDLDEWYAGEDDNDEANGTYTADTVFALRRNAGGKIEFLVDDVVVYTSVDNAEASLRLAAMAGTRTTADSFEPAVVNALFGTVSEEGGGAGTDCASEVGPDEGDSCSAPWTIPTPSAFPSSPIPSYFDELESDWGTHGHTFPDGSPRHNTIQTAQIRIFAVEWDGLDQTEAAILDDHYESTRGGLRFTLTHPYTAEVITGVQYQNYDRDNHQKVWSQKRSAKLIKYTS